MKKKLDITWWRASKTAQHVHQKVLKVNKRQIAYVSQDCSSSQGRNVWKKSPRQTATFVLMCVCACVWWIWRWVEKRTKVNIIELISGGNFLESNLFILFPLSGTFFFNHLYFVIAWSLNLWFTGLFHKYNSYTPLTAGQASCNFLSFIPGHRKTNELKKKKSWYTKMWWFIYTRNIYGKFKENYILWTYFFLLDVYFNLGR